MFFKKGVEYQSVVMLIQILSVLVLAIGLSNIIGVQYFIPTKQQNLLTLAVSIGACINFFLNLILIPMYKSMGAAISTIFAETVITLIMFFLIRKQFSLVDILKQTKVYFKAGTLMFFTMYFIGNFLCPGIWQTAFLLSFGIMVYVIFIYLSKDEFFIFILKKLRLK